MHPCSADDDATPVLEGWPFLPRRPSRSHRLLRAEGPWPRKLFEDERPRLVRVDGPGAPDAICVPSQDHPGSDGDELEVERKAYVEHLHRGLHPVVECLGAYDGDP